MVVQRKRRTSISISIYAVIENYCRDLDKYYCQHLIILLGSSNWNCSIKSIQKKGRERERKRRRERKGEVGRTKNRNKEEREREKKDDRWSLYQASRCIFKNKRKKIVACRYISVIIARVRRRVSCQIIGRLCEPIIREKEREKRKKREREREKIWKFTWCACTWEYMLMNEIYKCVNCKSCVQP